VGSFELAWADSARPDQVELLSPTELDRYRGMPLGARERFLAGRILLRELAARLTDEAQHDIVIVATCPDCGGPHGRPAVEGSRLHVGLAHSGSTVVAVASWDGPIGVDAETAATPASRIAAVKSLTGVASLRHWTRVEAVLKADGRGLRVDPSLVKVDRRPDGIHGAIVGDAATYRIEEPTIPGLQVAVALRD